MDSMLRFFQREAWQLAGATGEEHPGAGLTKQVGAETVSYNYLSWGSGPATSKG